MLDEKLDLEDLRSVDEEHHNGLTNILKNPLQQLGMDGLTFTTETSFFGQISTVDLIPNGSQTMVRSGCHEPAAIHCMCELVFTQYWLSYAGD